jgi:hypothetical protein
MRPKHCIIITLILFVFNCNSEKKTATDNIVEETTKPLTEADSIQNFHPSKRIWMALKTKDQKKVASIIGLEKYEVTNWELGIKNSYQTNRIDSRVFISPVINDEWIIVTGYDLPHITHKKFEDFAIELSSAFGHFSYYYVGKETFGLAKATNGNLDRYVYYNDNSVVTEKGTKTLAEKNISLYGSLIQYKFSEKLTKDFKKSPSTFKGLHTDIEYSLGPDNEVYVEYTIPWPNAKYIYEVAEKWSINPSRFIENNFTSQGLGLFGKTNYKY